MNNNHHIAFLSEYFKSSKDIESGYAWGFEADNSKADEIKEALTSLGYQSDDEGIELAGKTKFEIRLRLDYWSNGQVLFKNEEEFFKSCIESSKVPEIFYIKEGNSFSHDAEIIQKIQLILSWKRIHGILADHIAFTPTSKYIYFVTNDAKATKQEISFSKFNLNDLNALNTSSKLNKALQATNEIFTKISLDDAHSSERKGIMRVTLSKTLNSFNSGEKYFIELVNHSENIAKEYKYNYDLYVNQFSINKILSEIDTKSLEFTAKVTELVSSLQGKVLAMPGALALIGTLMKAGSGLGASVLVILALVSTRYIINTSSNIYKDSLNNTKQQFEEAMKTYFQNQFNDDIARKARSSQDAIKSLIESANARIDNISRFTEASFWIGILYVLYILIFTSP